MINECETIGCSFDKEKGEAVVTYNHDPREVLSFHDGVPVSQREYPTVTFTEVKYVIYVTDQNSGSYHYNGSEIERLKAELEKEKRENDILCEHFEFIREWFFIYQNAFDDIKNVCKREEREHPGIYTNPAAIIKKAEKKYAESQKRFEKVREKWNKKEEDGSLKWTEEEKQQFIKECLDDSVTDIFIKQNLKSRHCDWHCLPDCLGAQREHQQWCPHFTTTNFTNYDKIQNHGICF